MFGSLCGKCRVWIVLPAPIRGSALAPLAVEPGAAEQCVREDSALLPELLACSEPRIPGVLGKGRRGWNADGKDGKGVLGPPDSPPRRCSWPRQSVRWCCSTYVR